jgi:hypothetical protein
MITGFSAFFKNLPEQHRFNELYARDTAKKIKSTFKMKGESGRHLATNPPFGYVKDEQDKDKWRKPPKRFGTSLSCVVTALVPHKSLTS